MRKRLVRSAAIGAVACLASCQAMLYGTSAQLANIHPGMSRAEVLAQLGEPDSVEIPAQGEELLVYYWMPQVIAWTTHRYHVRLVRGRVETFGKG